MASSPDAQLPALGGRVAVVTGASRGIGLATARTLRAHGASVLMVARGDDELSAAAERIGGVPSALDVTEADAGTRVAAAVREAFGVEVPDILVNAAGAFELAALEETSVEAFDLMLAVNLRGPFLLIREFLPAMLRRRSGHIVSIGSVAGRHAFPSNGGYAASKFGLRGLHAVLDSELRGSGVRATLVEPAATDTSLWDTIDYERHAGLPPRAEMLPADAVADAILYVLTRPPQVDVRNLILERS